MKFSWVFIMFFFFLGASQLLAADPGEINLEAEGYGSSKSNALLNAKRNAIETGIGTVLVSETEIKNFRLQKDVVLTKTVGSVKKYNIIEQLTHPDGTYWVKIDVTVSLAEIKEDLAALRILLESMDKPRMMVLLDEGGGSIAQTALIDFLSKKEFELVDPAITATLLGQDDAIINKVLKGDVASVAKLAAENGAEYLIIGKVETSIIENDILKSSGMKSGQAEISAKVINCTTARIIASKSSTSAAVHVSEKIAKSKASEKAVEKLMDTKLFQKIVYSFQDIVNNGTGLDVTVNKINSFSQHKAVIKVLADDENVVTVNKRSFGGGKLALTIVFKGNSFAFAEAVDQKTAMGKKISVIDIKGNKVIMQLD
jgi:hypothetical protein